MNNINNTIIQKKQIKELIEKYTNRTIYISNFNYNYYLLAFTHSSFNNNYKFNTLEDSNCHLILHNKYFRSNNETLEYLGDAQLYAIIAEYLYDKYPNKDEGFLTKLRSKIISKNQLSIISKNLGFDKYLLISCHLENNNSRNNISLLENLFESFIGALYKDQGFDITKKFIIEVFEKFIDFNFLTSLKEDNLTDFKSKLLIYFHSKKFSHPSYDLIFKINNSKFYSCIILNKKNVNIDKYNNIFKKLTEKTINYIKKINEECSYNFLDDNYYLFVAYSNNKKNSEQECSKKFLEFFEKF